MHWNSIKRTAVAILLTVGTTALTASAQEKGPAAVPQAKPTLAPLCAGCHKPEPGVLMGTLDNIALTSKTLQLDLTSHKEVVKFTDATKLVNVASFEEMRTFKGKGFTVNFSEQKGDKVATQITRFDVLKTIKPEDKISKDELKKLMAEKKDLVIVDARPVPRYEEGHIPGAIVIPAAVLEKQADKLPKEKDRTLVFYCVGGCSSPIAAVKAKSLGYSQVKIYTGGMPDWVQTEYTIVTPAFVKNAISQDIPHVLIDTRPAAVAETGFIKGAVSITPDTLDTFKGQFPKQKSAPLILYGDASRDLAKRIIAWGYKGVRILPMTFDEWRNAGYPVAAGRPGSKIVFVPKPRPGTIAADDFKRIAAALPADTVLIDVRNADEFAAGHVKGAVNIPVDDMKERLAEVPKDKKIVLYCTTGIRAEMGYTILKEAGYHASCLDADMSIEKDGMFSLSHPE
jgi:rhodanese-related sulfurtransferase